jgi:hypothetical protein
MHVKEIYVIFIHLFDSGILLIIDLNKMQDTRYCTLFSKSGPLEGMIQHL